MTAPKVNNMYNYQKELKAVATAMDYTLRAYANDEIVEEPMIEAIMALRDCNDRDTLKTANTLLEALEEISDFRDIRDFLYEDLEETLALCDKEDIEEYEEYASVLFGVSDAELLNLWKELQPSDCNAGCWQQHWFI